MGKLFETIGGKKLGWCLIILALSSTAFFLGKMSTAAWVGSAEFLTYAFLGSNVAGMAVHGFGKRSVSSAAKAIKVEPPRP